MKTKSQVQAVLLSVLTLVGCGAVDERGERDPRGGDAQLDGGATEDGGAAAGGKAPEPTAPEPTAPRELPMKNGAPIGDCVDATAESLRAQGCPAEEPEPLSACEPFGRVCRYAIQTESGLARQSVWSCAENQGNWGAGALDVCGQACIESDAHPIELDVSECNRLTPDECDDGMRTQYAWPPTAYTLTQAMLQSVLQACGADPSDNLVQIVFSNGCPQRLTSDQELDQAAVECLRERLGGERWKCAVTLPCVSRVWSLL